MQTGATQKGNKKRTKKPVSRTITRSINKQVNHCATVPVTKSQIRHQRNISQIPSPVRPLKKTSQVKIIKKTSALETYFAVILIVLVSSIFVLGNKYWDDRYYTPEEGVGYYLGLVGGSMMLLAFAYTALKYFPLFRSTNLSKFWLKMHLVLGILGPFLIMFHSTFRIGSFNGGPHDTFPAAG